VGVGHNGLVTATILARTGRRLLVLERAEHLAARSSRPRPAPSASSSPQPSSAEAMDIAIRRV
jgi:2-polyprenyl-6-methoxyphenol hydroxylase-like FAD-dependent oxidoreductase